MLSTIRSQLIALALLTLLAVLLVGGTGLYAQGRLAAALAEAEGGGVAMRHHMQSDMLHDNLRGLVEQYDGAVRANDPARIADTVKELTTNSKNIQDEYGKNKDADTLPESVRAEISRVDPIVKTYAQAALSVAQGATNDPAALEKARADFTVKFKVLEKELGDIRDKIEAAVRDAKERGASVAQFTTYLTAGMLILVVFVVALVTFLFYQSLSGNMKRISQTIADVNSGQLEARTGITAANELGDLGRSFDNLLDERVGALQKQAAENDTLNNSVVGLLQTVFQLGNRDLTARAAVTEDIIGTVSSSINQFTDETGRTLSEVQDIAELVRQTSEAVRVQSVMVEETARSEREALQSMSSGLTQATEQLIQVASLSDQSNTAAEQVTKATQSALAAVDGTVKGIDQLRESISDMEKRFKRLGERSQEISGAVQLINNISERTHVLALNASMQAATAGEAGRGFAVVAEEVQRLSDSSRQATGQISQLVGNIQAETNETLFTVDRLIGDVVKQSELAQRAGAQMTQTQTTTAQLVGLVRQIAAFSDQQAKLASSLQQSVVDINHGNEQTSVAIAEQTTSTQTLAEFSRRLTQAVGQFKLADKAA